jgi:hypothetical protein
MAFNVYEWRRNQLLTESSINETKVSNVEFVAGDLYPSNLHLGSSERFQTKEKFEAWREKFQKMYGDIELEKGPAGWKPSKK